MGGSGEDSMASRLHAAVVGKEKDAVEEIVRQCDDASVLVDVFRAHQAGLLGTDAREGEGAVEAAVERCCAKCKPREIYVFLMEIVTHAEFAPQHKVRALPGLARGIVRMKGKKFLEYLCGALHRVSYALQDTEPEETFPALVHFGCAFVDPCICLEEEEATDNMGLVAGEDAVASFLFNLLPKVLRFVGPYPQLRFAAEAEEALRESIGQCAEGIAKLARRLLAAPPVYPFRAVTGDGGGSMETAPVSIAAYIYVTDVLGFGPFWARIPRAFSHQRRYQYLVWAMMALSKHHHHQCALALLCNFVAPLAPYSTEAAYTADVYQQALESLINASPAHIQFEPNDTAHADIFAAWVKCIRAVRYRKRFDIYLAVARGIKVDKIAGTVLTCAREDWWDVLRSPEKQSEQKTDRAVLRYQAMVFLGDTLDGQYTVVDGMDSLVAALNFARLVLLSPDCVFFHPELAGRAKTSCLSRPLPELLDALCTQVDVERRASAEVPAAAARVDCVAHLVARVREVSADKLSTAAAPGDAQPAE